MAGILLVAGDGSILLQHRTDDAPAYPGLWSVPSGAIEAGESPCQAAVRELAEETGLLVESDLVGELVPWVTGLRYQGPFGATHQAWAWAAPTSAVQQDVACYEGQAMRLVLPDEAAGLELAGWTALTLPAFLSSPLHADLAARAGR